MTNHLPECPAYGIDKWAVVDECGPCNWLRACERRVREDERALIAVEQTTLAELNAEYRKGLDAAREAVWESVGPGADAFSLMVLGRALAAIDALRGER